MPIISWWQKHMQYEAHHQFMLDVCNDISPYPITNPFKLATSSFIDWLALHQASLLIQWEIWPKVPCFLPNIVEPVKEQIDFVFWALFSWWSSCQRVLYSKEISEHFITTFSIWPQFSSIKSLPWTGSLDCLLNLHPIWGDWFNLSRMITPKNWQTSLLLNSLHLPANGCSYCPALLNLAFVFVYTVQFDTENLVWPSLFKSISSIYSGLSFRVKGRRALNQSNGCVQPFRLYF